MRSYSIHDEENLRDAGRVEEWIRSGLLDAQRGPALREDLVVGLRTTNIVFRGLLFLFTAVIIVATVGLLAIQLRSGNDLYLALLLGVCSLACVGIAWNLATRAGLYRCGVEEALAVGSVVLAGLAAGFAADWSGAWDLPSFMAVATAAGASFGIYVLFGFRYAAVGAVILSGLAPLVLDIPVWSERSFAALIFLFWFLFGRNRNDAGRDEILGEDAQALQAAAWAGLYAVLNQKLPWIGLAADSGWFYWFTYLMIWILPTAGLWWGLRGKDRAMIDVSAILGLATLVTNKSYLGWTRQTWDPILLGALLIGTAVVLRRWLAAGPAGERSGFTPVRLLNRENRLIDAAGIASVAVQTPGFELPKASDPGGGRSGGGGASGNF